MELKHRLYSTLFMLLLLFLGAFLLVFEPLQETGIMIIMFAAGFVLRETLESTERGLDGE